MTEVKAAGHECVTATLPPSKGTRKTGRLARLVREVEADAWVIQDGSLETLEWFVASGLPVLALGGVVMNLPIAVAAGYALTPLFRETVKRLIGLGHRRIVFICRHDYRLPKPGALIHALHEELQAVGVKPGEYNTPDWEESPDGLEALLKSLFLVTPPTALICGNLHVTAGVLGFLTKSGLAVPGDVSAVSMWHLDSLPEWAFTGVRLAHVEDDDGPMYRRVREWVTNVALGRTDTKRVICTARLVEGNTMGPAKKG